MQKFLIKQKYSAEIWISKEDKLVGKGLEGKLQYITVISTF